MMKLASGRYTDEILKKTYFWNAKHQTETVAGDFAIVSPSFVLLPGNLPVVTNEINIVCFHVHPTTQ